MDEQPEPIVVPTPARPTCCGEIVAVARGYAANFRVELWRCLNCERLHTTFVRIDGKNFWVGAMGRALVREQQRLIAQVYGGSADGDP